MRQSGTGFFVAVAILLGVGLLVGCQVTKNGQTLPSPHYLDNQIQYHPAGNEFQYQKEVDQIDKERTDRELARQGRTN